MPASVSSRTVAPSVSAVSRPGSRACSTDSWKVTTRPVNVTPRSEARRCRRRVSSTARTSAVAITSRSRGPTSPGCPRGAPPSTSRPLMRASLSRPRPEPVHLPWRHGGAGPGARGGGGPDPVASRCPRCAGGPRRARCATSRHRSPTTGGWPGSSTAVLGLATLVSRLWNITYPRDLLFDEAYYPPEAHELLTWGFEYNRGYSFIVHPPLGKWFIALGEQVFGYNSLGWRFPSAVAGAITVVVLVRLTRRLTGSTLMGLIAGLLLALDGFAFTLVADRPARRLPAGARGLRASPAWWSTATRSGRGSATAPTGSPTAGSGSGPAAGGSPPACCSARACAVKWSGVWFLAFFAVLSLFWDRAAWREAGVPRPTRMVLRRGLPGAVWALAVVPVLTYLASFTGWFLGETSQGKAWAQQNPDTAFPWIPDALRVALARAREVADVPQRPVDAAPMGVRPVVVAGQRPADPALEPAGPGRPLRRADRPLHPDGRDADALVRLRARAAVAGLADRRAPRPGGDHRRGRHRGGLADLVHQPRAHDVHLLHGAGAAVLRPGGRARPAGRHRPARGRTASAASSAWAWCACTSRWSRRRSCSSTRSSPGEPLLHSEWLLRMWFPSWF